MAVGVCVVIGWVIFWVVAAGVLWAVAIFLLLMLLAGGGQRW